MNNCINCGKCMNGMKISATAVVCKPCEKKFFGNKTLEINKTIIEPDCISLIVFMKSWNDKDSFMQYIEERASKAYDSWKKSNPDKCFCGANLI